MYKDFENQASWEREKKEYQLAWENLTNDYPDAFSSHEARENLKRLSNIDAIKERLEKAAKEKENIISQRLQEYLKSQANNLSSLVANLLEELESEKDRIRRADLNKILDRLKEHKKLSDKIETDFKDVYEKFVIDFIRETEDGLNRTLKGFIENAEENSKKHEGEREDDDIRSKKVEKDGVLGSVQRFLNWFDDWGYEEKQYVVKVEIKNIKAGAVVDLLIEMHDKCAKALNRNTEDLKNVFKEKLYEKILSKLCEIIQDNGLIDKYAFKKSVNAVTDKIKFEEFDYTDLLPSEIRGQTGFLEGDEANQFIKSVESYVRGFKKATKNDVKDYIKVLKENLKDQNFAADVLSRLVEEMQNLRNQVQNKDQSLAQLDAQVKALKEI